MGILVPEAYGGAGADYLSYALAVEEIAKVDAGTAVTVSVHSMICSAILKLGSQEQKDRWLAATCRARRIAGFALTESDAGSDAVAFAPPQRDAATATYSTDASNGAAREATRASSWGCFVPAVPARAASARFSSTRKRRRQRRTRDGETRNPHEQHVRSCVRRRRRRIGCVVR